MVLHMIQGFSDQDGDVCTPGKAAEIDILCILTRAVKLNLHSYRPSSLLSTHECDFPGSLPVLIFL